MVESYPKRERKIVSRLLATIGIGVGSIVAAGYLAGDKITTEKTVDIKLEQILKPRAIKMARIVLGQNLSRNNNIIITRPDKDSTGNPEEDVSLNSYVDNRWIAISAAMFRDINGQLDPTTVNEVDVNVYDCDPPGKGNICGGDKNDHEEIDLIYGDRTTFTKGNWGIEDDLTVAGFNQPNIKITTATKNTTEPALSIDGQHALREARIFSKVAMQDLSEALQGDIRLPKPKKSTTN